MLRITLLYTINISFCPSPFGVKAFGIYTWSVLVVADTGCDTAGKQPPVALTINVMVVPNGKPVIVWVRPCGPDDGVPQLLPPFVDTSYPVAPGTALHLNTMIFVPTESTTTTGAARVGNIPAVALSRTTLAQPS